MKGEPKGGSKREKERHTAGNGHKRAAAVSVAQSPTVVKELNMAWPVSPLSSQTEAAISTVLAATAPTRTPRLLAPSPQAEIKATFILPSYI